MAGSQAVPAFAPTGHLQTIALPAGTIVAAPDGWILMNGTYDLFLSHDEGYMWQALLDPSDWFQVSGAIAVSPDFGEDHTLWVGARCVHSGLCISSDGGRSWRSPQQPLPGGITAVVLSPDFSADRTVFAAGTGGEEREIYWSSDGGEHWGGGPSPGTANVQQMVVSPSFTVDGTLFARLADETVWASTDNGRMWRRIDAGLTGDENTANDLEAIDLGGNATALYIATQWGLILTFDLGETWYLASTASFRRVEAAPDFATSLTLYGVTRMGELQRSTDGGISWEHLMPYQWISDVAVSPDFAVDKTLYARTSTSFWVSHDRGQQWTMTGATLPLVSEFWFELLSCGDLDQDETVFAYPEVVEGAPKFLRSTDGAYSWSALSLPGTGDHLRMAMSPGFLHDRTLWAAMEKRLLKSTNGGETWVQQGGELPTDHTSILQLSPNYVNDQTLFLGDHYPGLYRSTDDGLSWEHLIDDVWHLAISPGYPEDPTLFIGRYNVGVLRSDDGGQTWIELDVPENALAFMIALSPTFPQDHTLFIGDGAWGDVFRSKDRGETWVDISGDMQLGVSTIAISPRFDQDQSLMVGMEDGQVYLSEDAGDHWFRLYGVPSPNPESRALLVYDDGLLRPIVSTPQGIYRYYWPVLSWQPTLGTICLPPGAASPVSSRLYLPPAVDEPVQLYWQASTQAGWLTLDPTYGPLPGFITLTVDPAEVPGSTSATLVVSAHRSLRLFDTFTVPVQAIVGCQRSLLPLVER